MSRYIVYLLSQHELASMNKFSHRLLEVKETPPTNLRVNFTKFSIISIKFQIKINFQEPALIVPYTIYNLKEIHISYPTS